MHKVDSTGRVVLINVFCIAIIKIKELVASRFTAVPVDLHYFIGYGEFLVLGQIYKKDKYKEQWRKVGSLLETLEERVKGENAMFY